MNTIVAKQCLRPHCVTKKTLKLDCFIASVWDSRYVKRISPLYSKTVRKQKSTMIISGCCWCCRQRYSKLYSICSTPKLSERNFRDGLEMKYTSRLGWIQQPVASSTVAKAWLLVLISVSDYWRLSTSLYFISTNFHTELKSQVNVSRDMHYPAYTLYTTMGVGRTEWVLNPSLDF